MGLNDAFDVAFADFKSMAEIPDANVFIGTALQKTHFGLDEKGIKAAAITYIGMKAESAMPEEKPQKKSIFGIFSKNETPQGSPAETAVPAAPAAQPSEVPPVRPDQAPAAPGPVAPAPSIEDMPADFSDEDFQDDDDDDLDEDEKEDEDEEDEE